MKTKWLLLSLFLGLNSFGVIAQQGPSGVFTYHFVITELPENTPHDAQLFLSGNFTKWNSAHPGYQFRALPHGAYELTIESTLPRLEYKVTSGNWQSVEGRESGKARTNRVLFRDNQVRYREVDVAILSWEDLSGTFHFYSVYDLLMLFAAFQGILLLLAVPGLWNSSSPATRWLVILLGLTSLLLFVRTVASYRDVAQAYTKLLLLPDLILFLYAPVFYIYLRKLLSNTPAPASGWWRHFVPVLVQVGVYMPYLLIDNKLLQLKIVNRDPWLSGLFLVMGLLGLFYNVGYWLVCRRLLRTHQARHGVSSTEPRVRCLNAVLILLAVCLALWLFFFGLIAVGNFAINADVISIAEKNVDFIWLTFSTIVYLLGYYAIRRPDLFTVPFTESALLHLATNKSLNILQEETSAVTALVPEPVRRAVSLFSTPESTESTQALKLQIDTYMKRQKPYTNPNLTLAELALRLRMTPHLLSKVVNETYGKNFFDFINQHRIEELKSRLDDPRFRSFTLLSMAYEVGFNSKTAFNRSFKKLTNLTPSEYLSTHFDRTEATE